MNVHSYLISLNSNEISIFIQRDFNKSYSIITDIFGKIRYHQNIPSQTTSINGRNLLSGINFINFSFEGTTSIQKFIRQ